VVRPLVERTGEAGDAAATVAARAEIMVASSSADGEREAGAALRRGSGNWRRPPPTSEPAPGRSVEKGTVARGIKRGS
jgi:hypothetical protein